jgi:DNA adenine methylase
MTTSQAVTGCPVILKSGERKGQSCGKPSKFGAFCGVHKVAVVTPVTAVTNDDAPPVTANNDSDDDNLPVATSNTRRLLPLFKWPGGKTKELPNIVPLIPPFTGRYIEPFVGGGSLFFYLNPTGNPVINDVHPEMTAFYHCIKEGKGSEIHKFMQEHPNEEKTYFDVRDRMPITNDFDLACRFYYQRKTCFRGISRYNKKGHFNICFGRYASINYSDLLDPRYQELLGRTEIMTGSFEKVFERYDSDDNFVFLDPPYDCPITDYGFCNFGREEHTKLATLFKTTKCKCLMVIGETPFIVELYRDYIVGSYDKTYTLRTYEERVGGNEVRHLVIKNYT